MQQAVDTAQASLGCDIKTLSVLVVYLATKSTASI